MRTDEATRFARLSSRLSTALMAVTLAGVTFVALALAKYTFPKADELFRAARVRDLGVPASIQVEYTTWSGRWAGTGLSYLLSATFNLERAYGGMLVAVVATIPLAVYVLLGTLYGSALSRRVRAVLALGFFVLYWCAMPSHPDGFYWLTGVLENALPIPAALLIVVGLLRCGGWSVRWRAVSAAGLMGAAATTVALHELYGLIFAVVLIVATLLAFAIRHPSRWVWAGVTVAAAGGLAIVAVAPGNANRMTFESQTPHNMVYWQYAVHIWGGFYTAWLFDPKLLAATALFGAVLRAQAVVPAWLTERPALWAIAVPATSILALFVPVVALWWVNPGIAPGRTQSAIYLIFLVGWFASVLVLLLAARSEPAVTLAGPARLALTVYLAVTLLSTGNLSTALYDLRGPAQAFGSTVRWRQAHIWSAVAKGERCISVPPLPIVPASFNCFPDLVQPDSTAPHAYVNAQNAAYFGIDHIALYAPAAKK
jgi:Family of unknown function (DUF6056)